MQIAIDSVQVPQTQTISSFSISISAIPAPINLDTIAFTLEYNADLVELQTPVTATIDCSSGNPLCNYSITFGNPSGGKLPCQLIRKNSQTAILDFATSTFSIPFICFVSQRDTTSIQIEDLFAGQQSTASFSPGRIQVGYQCGDRTLRAFLNNTLPAWLESIVPNPATGNVSVNVTAKEKGDAEISLVDNLGETRLRNAITLTEGSNLKAIDIKNLPSGSYQLILSSSGGNISSQILQIIH